MSTSNHSGTIQSSAAPQYVVGKEGGVSSRTRSKSGALSSNGAPALGSAEGGTRRSTASPLLGPSYSTVATRASTYASLGSHKLPTAVGRLGPARRVATIGTYACTGGAPAPACKNTQVSHGAAGVEVSASADHHRVGLPVVPSIMAAPLEATPPKQAPVFGEGGSLLMATTGAPATTGGTRQLCSPVIVGGALSGPLLADNP